MMRNEKIIDSLMKKVPKGYRYHWCKAGPCACGGCINNCGNSYIEKAGASPVTYEEWRSWINRQIVDEDAFRDIAAEVQQSMGMGGLAGTIYEEFAVECCKRYIERNTMTIYVSGSDSFKIAKTGFEDEFYEEDEEE